MSDKEQSSSSQSTGTSPKEGAPPLTDAERAKGAAAPGGGGKK